MMLLKMAITIGALMLATVGTMTGACAETAGTYAELSGVKLWFTDTGGSGIPFVLLHANTGNSEIWENQIGAFARAGYRVIAFDRRGWGKSLADPASGPQPGTIAGDLDALGDHLKLDKFHLLGVAGGGFAALDYAPTQPGDRGKHGADRGPGNRRFRRAA